MQGMEQKDIFTGTLAVKEGPNGEANFIVIFSDHACPVLSVDTIKQRFGVDLPLELPDDFTAIGYLVDWRGR